MTAKALAGIGAPVAAFMEDYDMPATRHPAEAAPFFTAPAGCRVVPLVVTPPMVRPGWERRRRAGPVTARPSLPGVLVTGAVAFVVYGTVAYGLRAGRAPRGVRRILAGSATPGTR
ncbi:hypothetical protein ACFC3O_32025 [Streptomyces sp. NPDC056007]|uniref:hypothetical protein n=1 Tax=Streptomyces sp. NPDC056007 TaxID=3345678 RepID=UPI00179D05DD|nr:hypothetical protein [Streptomyces sp. SJ1-7]